MEMNHFDAAGNAWMVDVSQKEVTTREAAALGKIKVSEEVMDSILRQKIRKGDVLSVAQIGGIMGCKHTSDLIPLCHPLSLTHASVTFEIHPESSEIWANCRVRTDGKTGVEMEALTGVSAALLTIYDMCKALDRGMIITEVRLLEKHGGKSGDFIA